ncbi:hypothetical protein ACFLZ2_02635 [Candidatus Margulisiibacteriota bacterium]
MVAESSSVGRSELEKAYFAITAKADGVQVEKAGKPLRPYHVYRIGELEVEMVRWKDYVPEGSGKAEFSGGLYATAFLFGTSSEAANCFNEWGWRASKWSTVSKKPRYAKFGGNVKVKDFRQKVEKAIIKTLKKKWDSSISPDNYKDYIKNMDAKSLILLSALAVEDLTEYFVPEATPTPDQSGTTETSGNIVKINVAENIKAALEGREVESPHPGLIMSVEVIESDKDAEEADTTYLKIDDVVRFQSLSKDEKVSDTCHAYTYMFENILYWFKFDLKAESLNKIYVVENWAPGHMWPTIVEFKDNGRVVGVELDPTIDDFHGSDGKHLETSDGWTSGAVPTNFYFNLMTGFHILSSIKPDKAEINDGEIRKIAGQFIKEMKNENDVFHMYSYFTCYLPMSKEDLVSMWERDFSEVPKDKFADWIYEKIRGISVPDT